MRSDRLLSILLLLQTHQRVPASELAARLEVSVRTIMRDVEALSASGVPVYAERGRHGGICLLPDFRTDVTGLTADEARALFVLVNDRSHTELGLGQAIGSALRKVMAALPEAHRDAADMISRRILIDPSRWRSATQPVTTLDVLQQAVFADRRVVMHYRRSSDQRVQRYTVDPYGLVDKASVWYLIADHKAQPKMFRVDRITDTQLSNEPVKRRTRVELAEVWETLSRQIEDIPAPVHVRVRVQPNLLGRFLRLHHADLINPPPTNRASQPDELPQPTELELGFRSLGATTQLLGYGADVEVLEPDDVRVFLVDAARKVCDHYGSHQRSHGVTRANAQTNARSASPE
jgi:predicted DNA-binding transcriptional regulator YafY